MSSENNPDGLGLSLAENCFLTSNQNSIGEFADAFHPHPQGKVKKWMETNYEYGSGKKMEKRSITIVNIEQAVFPRANWSKKLEEH